MEAHGGEPFVTLGIDVVVAYMRSVYRARAHAIAIARMIIE